MRLSADRQPHPTPQRQAGGWRGLDADPGSMSAEALASEKLELARRASEAGDREAAYQLSREASQLAPDSAEVWLYCAAFALTYEDRLACLNKVIGLDPNHAGAWLEVYNTLRHYTRHDPSLRYLEETDQLYRVLTGNGYLVTVPKDRYAPAPYPPPEAPPLRPAWRWLRFALYGLPLAGLLTVVCAPIAIIHAWRAWGDSRDMTERRRAQMTILYACFLWVVGLVMSALFALHL